MSQGGHSHIHPPPSNFFFKYLWSTDHKVIGKQFLCTTLIFLFLGGGLAMLMRWNLAYPSQPVPVIGKLLADTWLFNADGAIKPEGFNQLTTMHGTIMIFFVIIPILVGAFGNFLIPLHIGARDMAFPRLNALSYWLFWPACVVILVSFFVPQGPAGGGWTAYPPLSDLDEGAPGTNWGQKLWLVAIFLVGWTSILGAVNYLTTIIKMRAPGMTWSRLPLVTWAQFITAILQLLATPVLAAGAMMMLFDKAFGASFFIPEPIAIGASMEPVARTGGGHILLWQHVFWFYAHPAVYILILPSMGVASDLISTFARKPIFGYKAMVFSMAGISCLGFIVWGHHMFVSGMKPMLGRAFMISTMLIALPSAIKVFNWLGTLWGGQIRFRAPMMWAIGFVSMFIIGGLSGIFMAATPVDIHIHDTYIIVAHFHYVVFGGTMFAVFGGLYFWIPKAFGRMMNETLAKIHFWLTMVFFNATFFPMHYIGVVGHMRRISTPTEYPWLVPIQPWNVFISISAFLLGLAQLIFIVNLVYSLRKGPKAEENPWQANTLEWTLPSPVPYYNYERVPTVYRGPYEYSSEQANGRGDWLPQVESNGHERGGGGH